VKRPALWVLACALVTGCVSADKRLVARAAARYIWEEDRYEQNCTRQTGPYECYARQRDVVELKRQIALANEVQKVGPMPAEERKQLKRQLAKLEAYTDGLSEAPH
jgi:hypothetical protein